MSNDNADQADQPEIRIDIVSDVVCPWCIIGYKQLERAMETTGIQAEIHWHPFELNPDMPAEGEDLRDHIARKYGTTPEASITARRRLTDLGRDLGFSFAYTDASRMVNTFQAHQLLHWADSLEQEHALKMELFAAYFSHGRDVSATEVLVKAAQAIGLDGEEAAAILDDGRYAPVVRERQATWIRQGIQGVPAMVFQSKYLLSGAQGAENYANVLTQLATGEAA